MGAALPSGKIENSAHVVLLSQSTAEGLTRPVHVARIQLWKSENTLGKRRSQTTPCAPTWIIMAVDIDKLTHNELVALNHRIVERLKFLDSMQAHKDMMAFNIGARVSFDSGQADGRLLGTLLKFNRKTVTVVTDNGQKWNISPHLLSPVKDAKPTQSFVYENEKQLE